MAAGAAARHPRAKHNDATAEKGRDEALSFGLTKTPEPGNRHGLQSKAAAGQNAEQAAEERPHKEEHVVIPLKRELGPVGVSSHSFASHDRGGAKAGG